MCLNECRACSGGTRERDGERDCAVEDGPPGSLLRAAGILLREMASNKTKPVAEPSEPSDRPNPLDRDEKVKLDLPFTTALRALLKTPPPETKESDAPKGS